MNRLPIIFLMGPTASGKTSVVLELKKHNLNVEIISADSALVYKGMDIGTAKPVSSELNLAPHRLINIRNPDERYSLANFCFDSNEEIKKIKRSGNIPLLVGGTMLYFRALLQGLYVLPPTDEEIRNNLIRKSKKFGWAYVYKELERVDPISFNMIHCNDYNRIIRALEIFYVSGKTWAELKQTSVQNVTSQIYQFAIVPVNRELLYNRIEQRFYRMLDIGFEDEVRTLFEHTELHNMKKLSSMSCIGYRQMWDYLSGKIDYNYMVLDSIRATKKLAKKQLTWLRNWPNLYLLDFDSLSASVNKILRVLKIYIQH